MAVTNKLTLLVHVDALRHDYITEREMPFLYELAGRGVRATLVPPFGFEPDGAYLTGTYPETYRGGAHFVLAQDGRAIPFANRLPRWLDALGPYAQFPLRKTVERGIALRGKNRRIRLAPGTAHIPLGLLRHFDYCHYALPYEPGFGGRAKTLFDYLRDAGRKFLYHGYPEFDPSAEAAVAGVRSQFQGDADFAFVLIGDFDAVGHEAGPESPARASAARRVDQAIRDIYNHAASRCDAVDLIVFGDHGMVPVRAHVDLGARLAKLPIRLGRDYVYFLDSTMARFWFLEPNAEEVVRETLEGVPGGRLVNAGEAADYRIRYEDRRFGDLIYWAEGGVVIHPSFWHPRRPKKGMHGYRREVLQNHAALVVHDSTRALGASLGKLEMVDVFQTVMYSLFGHEVTAPGVYGAPLQRVAAGDDRLS